jgi:hypothetical protein
MHITPLVPPGSYILCPRKMIHMTRLLHLLYTIYSPYIRASQESGHVRDFYRVNYQLLVALNDGNE